jgi:ferrochelatase
MISRRRAPLVVPRYEQIGDRKGGASPIGKLTQKQAQALSKRFGVPVHVCMRYTAPRAQAVVEELARDHSRRVLLLPLYPHWSGSTTGSSVRDFTRAAKEAKLVASVRLVQRWGSHPGYVNLLAQTCQDATSGKDGHLVLSAHSLPEKYVRRGDPYPKEVQETARLVETRLTGSFASVRQGFQSAVGPVKWIGPQTGSHIEELAKAGASHVTLAPLGFVSDHIETLYDLDILYKSQAEGLGLKVSRARSFNDDPRFIDVLADLAQGPSSKVEPWTA